MSADRQADDLRPRPGRGWLALLGLGRRAEVAGALVITVMLTMVSAGIVAAPRLLAEAEQSSLDQAVARAISADRRLTIQVIDEFGPGFNDDPVRDQRELLDEVAAGIEAEVLARYGDPRIVLDTTRFVVDGVIEGAVSLGAAGDEASELVEVPTALPTFMTLRIHPELAAFSTLVSGREAVRTDERLDDGRRVLEFELSVETADELGWELDELVSLNNDPSDLTTRQAAGPLPQPFVARLVGLRKLTPANDPFWADDARLHRPTVADDGTGASVFAFGMIAADQLPTRPFAVRQRSPFFLEQRRDLVTGSITLDNSEATLTGLTSLESTFRTQPTLRQPGVRAGLGSVLSAEESQRDAARLTITLAAVGVIGVAIATLAQLLQTIFSRRRGWLTVARARGASRLQVVGSAVVELGLLAGVAVAAGSVLGGAFVSGGGSGLERSFLLGLWLGSVLAAMAMALLEVARPVAASGRAGTASGQGRWARVARWMLVVVAVAAIVTFRRRGVATDGAQEGLDPLIVLLPVLVPLAFVMLTRWLLPAVLRRLTSQGLRIGPGRLLGARRVVAAPDASAGVIAVIVLALTVAGLGLGVNRSLEQGAVDASWISTGASFRIETRAIPVAEAVQAIPGSVVAATGSTRLNIDSNGDGFPVQFTTTDVATVGELTIGTAADEQLPGALTERDLSGRVPVVAANRIARRPVRTGDVLARIGASQLEFIVVETRPEAFGRDSDWLIADRQVYGEVVGRDPLFSTLVLDVPDESIDELAAIADSADEQLIDRRDLLELQRDDPLSRAVRIGYVSAGLLAVLLALSALVAGAIVTARERRREVSVLGLLGAGPREISRAVASELTPPAVFGIAMGTLIGWLLARLYDGRLDLSSFAGGTDVAIRPDVVAQAAVGLAVAIVAVLIIWLLVRRIVTASVNQILRIDGAA